MAASRDELSIRYMLRRTLFPWKFQETIDEAVDYCRTYGVDEIIWKIDTEELSHGLPKLELIQTYIPWLIKSREQLAAAGVSMSINPWVTHGMRDAGWDNRSDFPDMDWITDINGTQTRSQGCDISPAWRKWFYAAYELYASARPRVVWIEDDIRIHRHRPVYWACFCGRHVAEFSKLVGRQLTRETLAAEILAPGEPSPLRKRWLDFCGASIAEVFETVRQRVSAVDPNIQLGLMCSGPGMHAMETRDWDRCVTALRGQHERFVLRPGMGIYIEDTARGLYGSFLNVAMTHRCVRQPMHSCSEIENWPFSRYAKSVRFTRAQVLISPAVGCPSMSFNLYDHVGTSLVAEPQYGKMLRDVRPRVDALVGAYGPQATQLGVGMLHHEQGPHYKILGPNAKFPDIGMGEEPWGNALMALGMPVTWNESPVTAITGAKLQAYRGRLAQIFSRGVLLDATALRTILEMGRKDLVGCGLEGIVERRELALPVEEITDEAFGGPAQTYMTVDHLGLEVRVGLPLPEKGARAVSHFIDPDRKRIRPAAVLFENKLGGRVAILPYDFAARADVWFMNWHRKRQMTAIVDWLWRGGLPLSVSGGAWPLPMLAQNGAAKLVSVLNVSTDDWPHLEASLHVKEKVRQVSRLGADGQWIDLPQSQWKQTNSAVTIRDDQPIPPLEMVTLRVE